MARTRVPIPPDVIAPPRWREFRRRAEECAVLGTAAQTAGALDILRQHAVDKRNCDRSFSHRRCHAFDVAASHIADSEHAWKRGLEQVRWSLKWPFGSCQV